MGEEALPDAARLTMRTVYRVYFSTFFCHEGGCSFSGLAVDTPKLPASQNQVATWSSGSGALGVSTTRPEGGSAYLGAPEVSVTRVWPIKSAPDCVRVFVFHAPPKCLS